MTYPEIQWIENGRIASIPHSGKISRESVDHWIEMVTYVMQVTPPRKTCYVLHDFTHLQISATPYAQSRAREVLKFMPELPSVVAFALPRTLLGQFLMLAARTFSRKNFTIQMFFSYDEALAWLKSKLADES